MRHARYNVAAMARSNAQAGIFAAAPSSFGGGISTPSQPQAAQVSVSMSIVSMQEVL